MADAQPVIVTEVHLKKLVAHIASAVGALTVATAVFGTAIAAADSYAGQTYADVSKALSGAKMKGIIASQVGDALPQDQCVVTHSEKAPWIKGDHFGPVNDTMLLYLNCDAPVASAVKPGNSLASPEGQAAKKIQDTADYINNHPEWCTQNPKDCKAFCDAHAGLCTATA